jgi:hypothetical protein
MTQTTFPKLDCRGGAIHYKLYRQDGTMQPMCAPDTPDNRFAVEWMQQHDRYTKHGGEVNERI